MADKKTNAKPIIGISTFWLSRYERTYTSVSHYYNQSVIRGGGLPLLIPLCEETAYATDFASSIDGLLLTGGNEDISPFLYAEDPIAELQSIHPPRDAWEMALLKAVLDQNKPVLGICRGAQVINVTQGGSLYQHLGAQVEGSLGHYPRQTAMHHLWHRVRLEPGSKVFELLGEPELMVNSFHNQSVKRVAPGFRATAHCNDGVIEAIESTEHDFVLGIQWHPEALTAEHPQFIKLFSALIQACRPGRGA